MLMGHKESPPPFLYLSRKIGWDFKTKIMRGVNFASGGSGIISDTGKQFVQVIPFSKQIEQFMAVYSYIEAATGPEAARSFIKKSIFLFSIGSNDILEYYQFNSSVKSDIFLTMLVNQYQSDLQKFMDIGARKFGIISVSSLGCVPRARALNSTGGCLDELNSYAQTFYKLVQRMLHQLALEYQGMIYSLGDTFSMTSLVLGSPKNFGFKEIKSACCGNGTFNGEAPCSVSAKICSNRNEFLFWDHFHPSQAAANLTASTLYDGSTQYVSPINFSQLVRSNTSTHSLPNSSK
uniref:GDSL esterase/lipase n=1 Tax=Kalanchoe fedtschenkoi TaxID=63787 RepID=A0A7N0UUU6_KALFE